MPLFNVDVEKRFVTEYWTNRYIVTAADLAGAIPLMNQIVTNEKIVTNSRIVISRARVSDQVPNTDNYLTVAFEAPGTLADNTPLLPLHNVGVVLFNTASGRPSRKLIRGMVTANALAADFTFKPAYSTLLDQYGQAMIAMAAFVDVDGQPFTSGQAMAIIGMRQLRRGSKKRNEPVLP